MKSNRCCVIFIIIIGLIFSIPIRDDDVKHRRYKPLGITSSKVPSNTRLLQETDSSGIFYTVHNAAPSELFKSIDKMLSWSQPNGDFSLGGELTAFWHDRANDRLYFCTKDSNEVAYVDLTDDTITSLGVPDDSGAWNIDQILVDVFIVGSDLWVVISGQQDGPPLTGFSYQKYVAPNWIQQDRLVLPGLYVTDVSPAIVVGTDAYFVWWITTTNEIGVRKLDTTIPDVLITSLLLNTDVPDSASQFNIAYDGLDSIFFIGEKTGDDYLFVYSIIGDNYTSLGRFDVALMQDRDNEGIVPNELEKAFGLSGTSDEIVYELKARRGGIVQLQDVNALSDASLIAVTDNFLMNSDGDVFEWTEVSDEIDEIEYDNGIIGIPQEGFFIAHPDFQANWNKGDSIKIYDQFDILEFWGIIKDKNRNDFGFYVFDIDAFSSEVYRTQYDNDYSADDLDTKQKDIIDNACDFCYRSSSIVGTTTTFDYKYKRAIAYLFYLGRFIERQIPFIEPDGKIWTEAYNGQSKQPQFYGATFNFKEEEDGTSGTDIEFVTGDLSDADGFADIITSFQGHKKALQGHVVAGDRYRVFHTHTANISPTYEFWIATDNIAKSQWFYVTNSGSSLAGANIVCAVGFNGSELRAQHGNGIGGSTTTTLDAAPSTNTPYHIRLDVDCVSDTIDVYLNGVLKVDGEEFFNDQTFDNVNTITLFGATAADTYNTYWDAIGFSFDPAYTVGDNSVGWELSNHWQNHRLIDIPDIRDIQTGYFDGNTGITRANVRYRDNLLSTKPTIPSTGKTAEEQLKGILPLKEFDDPKLEESTESDQLATNLHAIFALDTIFLALYVEDQGFMQPGRTLEIQNTGQITIAKDDYVILQYTRDPKNDRYYNMILSDNIILTSEFKSLNDTSPKQLRTAIVQSFENQADIIAHLTREGGVALRLTNETGAASVKGTIVEAHAATDNAFRVCDASSIESFGVVYEDGIAEHAECLVVIGGRVRVLLKDATASARNNWVGVSDVPGRADASGASPAAAPQHFKEIGHCIETKGADTDVLAYIILHFL